MGSRTSWSTRPSRCAAAVRPRADGGLDYHRIENGVAASEPYLAVSFDDAPTTHPLRYTTDGRTLYWIDSRDRNTASLVAEDVQDGARTVLAEDARVDIETVLFNPVTGVAEAYAANYLRTDWIALDPAIKGDLDFLAGAIEGDITIQSRTDADDLWVLGVDPVVSPPAAYLYDRTRRQVTQLYVTRPELVGAPLQPMRPVEITSRDGLVQPSYLTLPAASAPDAEGRPTKSVPMVLFPHGGPWARDVYGYNPFHQYLANRGYAVLSPNFRGSTGFGKAHLAAGYLEWGATMHDDLLDAVQWAVDQGITTGRPGRHHGRLIRRLLRAGGPGVHARDIRLRRRHRRAVQPEHPLDQHPRLLGADARAALQARG